MTLKYFVRDVIYNANIHGIEDYPIPFPFLDPINILVQWTDDPDKMDWQSLTLGSHYKIVRELNGGYVQLTISPNDLKGFLYIRIQSNIPYTQPVHLPDNYISGTLEFCIDTTITLIQQIHSRLSAIEGLIKQIYESLKKINESIEQIKMHLLEIEKRLDALKITILPPDDAGRILKFISQNSGGTTFQGSSILETDAKYNFDVSDLGNYGIKIHKNVQIIGESGPEWNQQDGELGGMLFCNRIHLKNPTLFDNEVLLAAEGTIKAEVLWVTERINTVFIYTKSINVQEEVVSDSITSNFIDANAIVTKNLTVDGDFTVEGDLKATNLLASEYVHATFINVVTSITSNFIDANAIVTKNLTVDGDVVVDASITTTNITAYGLGRFNTIQSSVSIDGLVTFTGDVKVTKNLIIAGRTSSSRSERSIEDDPIDGHITAEGTITGTKGIILSSIMHFGNDRVLFNLTNVTPGFVLGVFGNSGNPNYDYVVRPIPETGLGRLAPSILNPRTDALIRWRGHTTSSIVRDLVSTSASILGNSINNISFSAPTSVHTLSSENEIIQIKNGVLNLDISPASNSITEVVHDQDIIQFNINISADKNIAISKTLVLMPGSSKQQSIKLPSGAYVIDNNTEIIKEEGVLTLNLLWADSILYIMKEWTTDMI